MTILQELRRRAREAHSEEPSAQRAVSTPAIPLQKNSGGPGTELTKLLSRFNFRLDDPGCKCEFHAHIMDRLGPVWCRNNSQRIYDWLKAELDRRQAQGDTSAIFAFVAKFGINSLVDLSIRRAEKKGFASRIFLIGYPGKMGGANTEAIHTLQLWKDMGLEVNLVPTWVCDVNNEIDLTSKGFITHHASPDALQQVPNLSDSITVGMCNSHYMNSMGTLKTMRCKIIWVNCMTFLFSHERQAFSRLGCPDAMVYQSQYQRTTLERMLPTYGYDPSTGHLIHGAFDTTQFPYQYSPRPNPSTDPFVIGKLARPDSDKWPGNLWKIFEDVQHPGRKAMAMGCRAETYLKIGQVPPWADCFPPMHFSSPEFLSKIHCCVAPNGGAAENWSRIGLECMSAGVPLVVPNQWGWPEMVIHGETGFLANSDEELSSYTTLLAYDEPLRFRMAEAARAHLVQNLANPAVLRSQWEELLFRIYEKDEHLFVKELPPAKIP